jgi:N-methylhydantoinase A/oxoprolinase/acetone carboxylase beta subunit
LRPVETLLSGPAASVMGMAKLTNDPSSIVVDMGGTTTDIALISDCVPYKANDGVSIGKWKTFVSGLYIKTLGLGGDSAIHYKDKNLILEEYRVVPLCIAADKHPQIIDNLKALLEKPKKHSKFLHEHYLLVRDISADPRYSEQEKLFCAGLKDGPKILREAAASIPKMDIFNLNVSRLLKDGVIQMSGLTPTDIMHIRGDYNQFRSEASVLGAEFVALNLGVSVEELCDAVYDEVKRKLYVSVVKAMLENKNQHYLQEGIGEEVERFINESYEIAKSGLRHDFISVMFSTSFVLAGAGAPIHLFLPDVARMLGTKAVIPEHYEVANALGAVVGNVFVEKIVKISANYTVLGIADYTVFGDAETKTLKTLEEAEAFAIQDATEAARREAQKRGAQGELTTTYRLEQNIAEARGGVKVYLGTEVVGLAVGSVGL